MTAEPESPNTVRTALKIWSTAAAIILTITVVIPCAIIALPWIYFALGGRVGT